MKFFLDEFRIICHGFTGKMGTYHSKLSLLYYTNIVCGISPNKGGTYHLDKPVFNNVFDAIKHTNANASLIFVPAFNCKDSILEAIYSGIKFIVCITEGIPIIDMFFIKKIVIENNVTFIGPNSPGLVIPNKLRMGIMPIDIHKPGCVGIVSRSGTLTYEAIRQTSHFSIGQSLSLGIGGDPIIGINFVDMINYFNLCDNTKVILIIGEIGGFLEEELAFFLKNNTIKKPIFAYIAGLTAPLGKRMGHAGAIAGNSSNNAYSKINILKDSGVFIIDAINNIGQVIFDFLKKN